MVSIDIDVRESKELLDFVNAFRRDGMKTINNELHRIAVDVRNDILKSMRSSPAGGKTYKRGGIAHVASLPGYPPRVDRGDLWSRIFVEKGYDFSRVYTENVIYAHWLEEGTKFMQERPFFGPAVDRSRWQERIRNRIIAERFAGRRIEE